LKKKKIQRTKGYWEDIENRRQFFQSMANDLGFDPLQPAGWKHVKNKDVIDRKASQML